jgi:glycosyltransferase 2 family protein
VRRGCFRLAVNEVESDDASAAVARSPADILRLVVAAAVLGLLLLVQGLFGDTLVSFSADLLRGLDALPDWLVATVVVGTRILAAVILVGGGVFVVAQGRWRFLLTVGLGAVLAVLLVKLFDEFGPSPSAPVVDVEDWLGPLSSRTFPTAAGVAAVSAVMAAGAPWMSRRWRRFGWALVVGVTLTRFLVSAVSFDSLRAALTGWFAGAAVLVVLGGPLRRPTRRSIIDGLTSVGVPLSELHQAKVDARGSTPYFGTTEGGQALFVKALGEDQRSADLLFRLYRRVMPRDLGDEKPFSSLRRAVEHEALVALAARDLGIRTPRLAAFSTAEPNAFVLAYEAIEGRSLDRLAADELTDEILDAIWDQMRELRRHRIAHRDLRLANIFLAADGEIWMIDFGFSELAASDLLLANDLAELVASSALQVGPERAIARARAALGPSALTAAADRLRSWSLSGATRTGMKEQPGLLDTLRQAVTGASADSTPTTAPR